MRVFIRQVPGHSPEEGEAQDGGEHVQLHGGRTRSLKVLLKL